jgi:hypothetical protein
VIEVRSTATGRVLDTLNVAKRLGGQPDQVGGSLTAAADRHTFFVKVHSSRDRSPTDRIYRFHITAGGHIAGLTRVSGVPERGFSPTAMAVSPDGRRLAIGGELSAGRTVLMIVNVGAGTQDPVVGH